MFGREHAINEEQMQNVWALYKQHPVVGICTRTIQGAVFGNALKGLENYKHNLHRQLQNLANDALSWMCLHWSCTHCTESHCTESQRRWDRCTATNWLSSIIQTGLQYESSRIISVAVGGSYTTFSCMSTIGTTRNQNIYWNASETSSSVHPVTNHVTHACRPE